MKQLLFRFDLVKMRISKFDKLKRVRSRNLVWLAAAVSAFCVLSNLCYAQIEVDAYITDPLSGKIFVFNTANNTSVGAPILAGSLPVGVAVSPDGRYTYVTNNGNSTLSIIDTVTHVVVGSTNVASGPIGVAVTPNGKFVYVTSPGPIMNSNGFVGNTVAVIKCCDEWLGWFHHGWNGAHWNRPNPRW
jgi:YVTN family beta-propeller protein